VSKKNCTIFCNNSGVTRVGVTPFFFKKTDDLFSDQFYGVTPITKLTTFVAHH